MGSYIGRRAEDPRDHLMHTPIKYGYAIILLETAHKLHSLLLPDYI